MFTYEDDSAGICAAGEKRSARTPLGTDCLWAFGVGGGICLLGEVLRQRYLALGLEADLAGTLTSCTLIALSAVLTTLGLYQKLAARAGAGSLVPITGFANAVVSAAIEFKTEGRILGTGAKMFTIAGPVIVYGTLSAVVYGGGALAAGRLSAFLYNTHSRARRLHHPGEFSVYHKIRKKTALKGGISDGDPARRYPDLLRSPRHRISRGGGRQKEGEGPLAAGFDELRADNSFGQSGWEAAEAELQLRAARLCLKKHRSPKKRSALCWPGISSPVHGLQLCPAGAGHPLRRAVRGLQHYGRSVGAGGRALFRRDGRRAAGHVVQPFLRGRASVPHPAQLRSRPHPHGPVDCHRRRGLSAAARRAGRRHPGRDLRPGAGLPDQGHQQHGRSHGPPAAAATLLHYLRDTHSEPQDFDAIYTGDLGHVGSQLFRELLAAEGLLLKNHVDCGCILYDAEAQAVKSGGSGAGAAPPFSAPTSCPGWSGAPRSACSSSPPGR